MLRGGLEGGGLCLRTSQQHTLPLFPPTPTHQVQCLAVALPENEAQFRAFLQAIKRWAPAASMRADIKVRPTHSQPQVPCLDSTKGRRGLCSALA